MAINHVQWIINNVTIKPHNEIKISNWKYFSPTFCGDEPLSIRPFHCPDIPSPSLQYTSPSDGFIVFTVHIFLVSTLCNATKWFFFPNQTCRYGFKRAYVFNINLLSKHCSSQCTSRNDEIGFICESINRVKYYPNKIYFIVALESLIS